MQRRPASRVLGHEDVEEEDEDVDVDVDVEAEGVVVDEDRDVERRSEIVDCRFPLAEKR